MADIEKFDPSTLMQGVRDRIKATFVSLIPDDQWDQMVQKEINAFFESSATFTIVLDEKRTNYNDIRSQTLSSSGTASPFRLIVWQLCWDKTQEIIKKKLTDEYFGNCWPLNEDTMNEKLKELIIAAAPESMLKFFQSISFNSMERLRQEIQNHRI